MATAETLKLLIDKAASIAGSKAQLANLMGIPKSHITQMKKGERPANWRARGKLRAILGESPEHAFMAAMAEDLEQSENEDEKKAASGFKAMLAALPDQSWRRRMITALRLDPLHVLLRLRDTVHRTLCGRLRNSEFVSKASIRGAALQILFN